MAQWSSIQSRNVLNLEVFFDLADVEGEAVQVWQRAWSLKEATRHAECRCRICSVGYIWIQIRQFLQGLWNSMFIVLQYSIFNMNIYIYMYTLWICILIYIYIDIQILLFESNRCLKFSLAFEAALDLNSPARWHCRVWHCRGFLPRGLFNDSWSGVQSAKVSFHLFSFEVLTKSQILS